MCYEWFSNEFFIVKVYARSSNYKIEKTVDICMSHMNLLEDGSNESLNSF